jgi:hypothetical protein
MREVEPMQMPEFGLQYADARIAACERTGERLAGVNDLSAGINPTQDRTLGENQIATAASAIRTKRTLKRLQLALEDVAQIRHAIWKRTLASQPDGVEAPQSLMQGSKGAAFRLTSSCPTRRSRPPCSKARSGSKPHGSVDTADPSKRRNDLIGFMQVAMQVARVPAVHAESVGAAVAVPRVVAGVQHSESAGVPRESGAGYGHGRPDGADGDAAGDGDAWDATGHAAECGDGGRPAAGDDAAAESRGDAAVHQHASVMCCTAISL